MDADGDGRGDANNPQGLCGIIGALEDPPQGYADNSLDCCDVDPDVPGLASSTQSLCGSWDRNCDGKATKPRVCSCSVIYDGECTSDGVCGGEASNFNCFYGEAYYAGPRKIVCE